MARIKETFDSRAWFMLECDDHNCEQRFDDSQWYAYEDDLLADAKDDGWQILYKDEHPELERDMHYCPVPQLPVQARQGIRRKAVCRNQLTRTPRDVAQRNPSY